jgi:hypothetical protein
MFPMLSMSWIVMLYVVFITPYIMIYHKIIYGFYFHINKKRNFFLKKQNNFSIKGKIIKIVNLIQ